MFDSRDPDANLVPVFRIMAPKDEAKSLAEGRPIHVDVEVVDLRSAGSKNYGTFPATEFCGWRQDPVTGEQVKWTYAERFARQYQQFKAKQGQTKIGTPLDVAPFLTESRRAELRALNVYTVEQLADIEGTELKNLGVGGRDLKNRAAEWMSDQKATAPNQQMLAEFEALRARNQLLEEDMERLKARTAGAESEFEEMTEQQLINYIKDRTGFAPTGEITKNMLIRMAMGVRPNHKAA